LPSTHTLPHPSLYRYTHFSAFEFCQRLASHLTQKINFGGALATGCHVAAIHGGQAWSADAYMLAPLAAALMIPPRPAASEMAHAVNVHREMEGMQQAALDEAAARLNHQQIKSYYSGCWLALASVTLSGELPGLGATILAALSTRAERARDALPTQVVEALEKAGSHHWNPPPAPTALFEDFEAKLEEKHLANAVGALLLLCLLLPPVVYLAVDCRRRRRARAKELLDEEAADAADDAGDAPAAAAGTAATQVTVFGGAAAGGGGAAGVAVTQPPPKKKGGGKKKGTAMTELTAARRRGGKQEKERLFDAEEGSGGGGGGGALPPPWVKAAGSTPTPAVGTDADSLD